MISIHPISENMRSEWLSEIVDSPFQIPSNREILQKASQVISCRLRNIHMQVILANRVHDVLHHKLQRILRRAADTCEIHAIDAPIQIWVIADPVKRTMPPSGHPIQPSHINGGYTYRKGSSLQIVITRWEECSKVILHEILHHSIVDRIVWTPHGLAQLYETWNIDPTGCGTHFERAEICDTKLRPNEAIVEFWAQWMQCKFLSSETGIPFETLYQKELAHVIDMASALLEHQKTLPKHVWKEETHAFSYVILRGLLWMYADAFIQLPMPYTESTCIAFILQHWPEYLKHLHTRRPTHRPLQLRMTHVIGDF